jgi:hypothetical protein
MWKVRRNSLKNVRKYDIKYHITEPDRPNHNFAEGVIREIRKKWLRVSWSKSESHRDFGITGCDGFVTYKIEPLTPRWIERQVPAGTSDRGVR